jgi:hypothetical protein
MKILTSQLLRQVRAAVGTDRLASHSRSVRGGGRERQRTGAVAASKLSARLDKQGDQIPGRLAEMINHNPTFLGAGA